MTTIIDLLAAAGDDARRSIENGEPPPPVTDLFAFAIAMNCIAHGIPCPQPFALIVARNWERFQYAECGTLGEAFGFVDQKHLSARRAELNRPAVFQFVRELRSAGLPLKDSRDKEGAVSVAARAFSVSPQTIHAELAAYRRERKAAGGDADKEWRPVAELMREVGPMKLSGTEVALMRERLAKTVRHVASNLKPEPKNPKKT